MLRQSPAVVEQPSQRAAGVPCATLEQQSLSRRYLVRAYRCTARFESHLSFPTSRTGARDDKPGARCEEATAQPEFGWCGRRPACPTLQQRVSAHENTCSMDGSYAAQSDYRSTAQGEGRPRHTAVGTTHASLRMQTHALTLLSLFSFGQAENFHRRRCCWGCREHTPDMVLGSEAAIGEPYGWRRETSQAERATDEKPCVPLSKAQPHGITPRQISTEPAYLSRRE